MARNKLRNFEEELHAAHEAGMTSYSGMKAWSFVNGIIYCMTIVTTIGKLCFSFLKRSDVAYPNVNEIISFEWF